MSISQQRQGELLILGEAVLWSFFPILTILTYQNISPLISLAGSIVFSAVFFAILMTIRQKWHEIGNISALKDVFFVALFIGVLYYVFYFYGLKYTSAGHGGIIGRMEILFSYLFFNVWRKEFFSGRYIVGALLVVGGAVIILTRNFVSFHLGDFLVLIATMCPPIGNYFQRRARKKISSETILFLRTVISLAFILLLIFFFREPYSIGALKNSLIFLVVSGVVLFGISKIMWLEGIHRISVTKANALSSIAPLFTLFIAWIFLGEVPVVWQFLSLIPMLVGVKLLTENTANNQG